MREKSIKVDTLKSALTRLIIFSAIISIVTFCFKTDGWAVLQWDFLQSISLNESPKDITISQRGDVAYILCLNSIQKYSFRERKITDTIPLSNDFSQIALSPDGEKLLLTDSKNKQISIIQLFQYYDMEISNSPVIGKKDAPVAIFAFLDFQCPYCSKLYPILEQLLTQYPNEVKLVIKHYPLQMHGMAEKASIAVLAAEKQKKYKEMSRTFFRNFKKINDITIKKFAEQNGLNIDQFQKDCSDPSLKIIVQKDIQLGKRVNVHGVPALFINGRLIKNRFIPELSNIIEQELIKKK